MLWLYPTTIFLMSVIAISGIFVNKSFATLHIKRNWRSINIIFGISFLILFINFFIFKMLEGGYFQLLAGDLCPFLALFSIPSLLFSKNKDNLFMKVLAPWMIASSAIVMLSLSDPYKGLTTYEGTISYLRHALLFAYGLIYFQFSKQYTKKNIWHIAAFIPIMVSYILLTSGVVYWATGDSRYAIFTSALFKESYYPQTIVLPSGSEISSNQYAFFSKTGFPYPIPTITLYALCTLLSCVAARYLPSLVNNVVVRNNAFEYQEEF